MTEDTSVYRRQGFGQTLGFGAASALLVIDFTNGFADPGVLGGGSIQAAIRNTIMLLAAARSAHIPIAYTRHAYAEDGSNFGLFNVKLPTNNLLRIGSRNVEIVSDLAPVAGELVLDKQYPSAFFGTILASWLSARRIDTVMISGCTTSGCVRASAVDAMCAGFRPIVVRDCVGDRAEGPHELNLFDLQQKYADVVKLEDALSHMAPGQPEAASSGQCTGRRPAPCERARRERLRAALTSRSIALLDRGSRSLHFLRIDLQRVKQVPPFGAASTRIEAAHSVSSARPVRASGPY